MKLASILTARAVALIDIDEFNIKGAIRFADLVPVIARQFNFLIVPSKVEDFDLEKGVFFGSGKVGEKVIDVLKIFPHSITIECLSSTDDSKAALEEILSWGREELGLSYTDGMIQRWGYISQITFYCDFPLLNAISAPLLNLARKTGKAVDSIFEEGIEYEVAKVNVGHDPLMRKNGIAGITIEHRANVQFGDNKFFSEAPLPTSLHIKFLEEFEAEVMRANK
ncbi:hypothetical protein [Tunturiibacter gelidoferens]|uniref:Uncharacterized protein n=1 Tax=Tunturiibacter gelidiferens TaxID=3069689 RepID=A0ACC5P1C0_9BACT|nr:hypothetical protein [Edaphobacter lichenicola]MBB5340585.1 hypothetical protein [Edaphobacter lichenicola]